RVSEARVAAFLLNLHCRVEHEPFDALGAQAPVLELNEALTDAGELPLVELAVGEANDEDHLDQRLELLVAEARRDMGHAVANKRKGACSKRGEASGHPQPESERGRRSPHDPPRGTMLQRAR